MTSLLTVPAKADPPKDKSADSKRAAIAEAARRPRARPGGASGGGRPGGPAARQGVAPPGPRGGPALAARAGAMGEGPASTGIADRLARIGTTARDELEVARFGGLETREESAP